MMQLMQRLKSLPGNMGIYLGSRQVRVPKQHLYNTQVSAIIEEVGCKGMSQSVWGKVFLYTRSRSITLDPVPECLAGHRHWPVSGEQGVGGVPSQKFATSLLYVTEQPVYGLFTHGHQPLFATFAGYPDNPLAKVYLVHL
jgi:hypothetical protein